MASRKIDPIFTWGDAIRIKQNAPDRYNPGSLGSVCGIRTINSLEVALQFDQMIDSQVYLIEFCTGEAFEIPEVFLSPFPTI